MRRTSRARDTQVRSVGMVLRAFRPIVRHFDAVAECQAFVDKVTDTAWFKRHFPRAARKYTVRDGRRRRYSSVGYHDMYLPHRTRDQLTILSLLAHASLDGVQAWNGREYAGALLKLVQHYLGRPYAGELKALYKDQGVKYRPKGKGGNRKGNPGALLRYRMERARAQQERTEAAPDNGAQAGHLVEQAGQ